jgi:hypothetical protein
LELELTEEIGRAATIERIRKTVLLRSSSMFCYTSANELKQSEVDLGGRLG